MAEQIKKITIVSGAPNNNIEFLKNNIDLDSYILAADSGYLKLLNAGITPNAIIGDFDSSPKPDIDCDIFSFPVEKAYSDTFNCILFAFEKGFNDITIFFAIGNRFDHSYSNVLSLDFCRRNNIKCRIVDDKNRISLINERTVFKKEYEFFSLFAFLEPCKGVRIKGAHYSESFFDADFLNIEQSDIFAQSNQIENDECEITIESGTLLLIESND